MRQGTKIGAIHQIALVMISVNVHKISGFDVF